MLLPTCLLVLTTDLSHTTAPDADRTPRTSKYDDEFNYHHDVLTEEQRRKKEAYLKAREEEARARAQEPDSDEEIDKGLERGDMDVEEQEAEEAKKRAAAQAASIVAAEAQKAGGLGKGVSVCVMWCGLGVWGLAGVT